MTRYTTYASRENCSLLPADLPVCSRKCAQEQDGPGQPSFASPSSEFDPAQSRAKVSGAVLAMIPDTSLPLGGQLWTGAHLRPTNLP